VFIDLVDALRCPRAHEDTWLVASADRTDGRDIVEGTLGCPICHAEYPIRGGVVWFDATQRRDTRDTGGPASGDSTTNDAELAMRLAAFLDLADAQGFALLAGAWARCAQPLRDLVPTHLVLLNPRFAGDVTGGVSVLQAAGSIPLADAVCRGVALDADHAEATHAGAAVRVLAPRGRLVAPAATRVPHGVTELARDAELWVAERAAAPPRLVTLRGRVG
jgi:hypothetical protein